MRTTTTATEQTIHPRIAQFGMVDLKESEMDAIPYKLSEDENSVLSVLLREQRAFTRGELQRTLNYHDGAVGRTVPKTSWRKIKSSLKTLVKIEAVIEDAGKDLSEYAGKDKRAKSRIYIEPSFAMRWQARRLDLLNFCAEKYPNRHPEDVLGALGEFYSIRRRTTPRKERLNHKDKSNRRSSPIPSFSIQQYGLSKCRE